MRKYLVLCLLWMAAAQMSPMLHVAAAAAEGTTLFSEDGHRLGIVYKVADDGSAKLIFDGKLVTIPASTLTDVSGKLTTTTLNGRQVYGLTRESGG
jgi:hypothetical protein